jgi:hypothetical protein
VAALADFAQSSMAGEHWGSARRLLTVAVWKIKDTLVELVVKRNCALPHSADKGYFSYLITKFPVCPDRKILSEINFPSRTIATGFCGSRAALIVCCFDAKKSHFKVTAHAQIGG